MIDDEDREERIARVNAEARRTIERVSENIEKRREEFERLPPLERARRLLGPTEDPVAKWKREADDRAAVCERERAEFAAASRPAPFDWSAFDERIAEAIAVEHRLMAQAFGEELGKLLNEERRDVMRKARDELHSLKLEVAKHASEVAALREALAVERGRVVDMPSPLARRVN